MATGPGNSLRTAKKIALNPTLKLVKGSLTSRDGNDYYRFQLGARSSFNLTLTGIAKKANADVVLLNSAGRTITSSKQPKNRSESIKNRILDPGVFYVRVLRRSGTTKYSLKLGATPSIVPPPPPPPPPPVPTPTDNAGNSFAQASLVSTDSFTTNSYLSQSISDFVGDVDPDDYFRFVVPGAGQLSLQLAGLTADADIQLFDGNGSLLAPIAGDGNTGDSIVKAFSPSDVGSTYYVRVFPAVAGANTNYTLNFNLLPLDTVGDTFAQASPLNLTVTTPPAARSPVSRPEFVSGTDVDVYSFSLASSAFVSVDLANLAGNADVELYSDNGGNPQVLLNSTRTGTAPEQIGGTLGAGNYYIRVFGGSADTFAGYNLTVFAESANGIPSITRDISFGQASSSARELTNVNGFIYFVANDQDGVGLWKSNGGNLGGTLDQTVKVKSFGSSGRVLNLTNLDGTLFFAADDGLGAGLELWKSGGTDATTSLVLDSRQGDSAPRSLTTVGSLLYYVAPDVTGDLTNEVLWRSDGTALGTSVVANSGSLLGGGQLTNVNGVLYYSARDNVNPDPFSRKGFELWRITSNGVTPEIIDVNPGTFDSTPRKLTAVGNDLFFVANTVNDEDQLRRITNGSSTPITYNPTGSFNSSVDVTSEGWNIVGLNGFVYFAADPGLAGDEELYRVDLANANPATAVSLFANIRAVGGSGPRNLTTVGNQLFFTANSTSATDQELFVTNGTAPPLQLTTRPDTAGTIQNLVASGGKLYFSAEAQDVTTPANFTGRELFSSDGTVIGTKIVFDIYSGGVTTLSDPNDPNTAQFTPNSSNPTDLTDANGRIFFVADNGLNGQELWTVS